MSLEIMSSGDAGECRCAAGATLKRPKNQKPVTPLLLLTIQNNKESPPRTSQPVSHRPQNNAFNNNPFLGDQI